MPGSKQRKQEAEYSTVINNPNAATMRKMDIETKTSNGGGRSCLCVLVTVLTIGILCLVSGIVAGYFIGKNKFEKTTVGKCTSMGKQRTEEQKESYYKEILEEMKADNIRNNLKNYTEFPHPPGMERNEKLADQLYNVWGTNMDKVEKFKYNIYLSYPTAAGEITLPKGKNTTERKLIINKEPAFDDSEKNNNDLLFPFNAFSANGTVTGELVYGNYGRDSDFAALKAAGVDLMGKIIIFRYGKTSRSRKVFRAQYHKAIGCIIFSDPYDHTVEGEEYPQGWSLNRYGVQRGTVNWLPGDALSIGYPAKDDYFRKNESKYSGNPEIPSQPISYGTAYEVLKYMKLNSNDTALPSGFQGGLNISYPLTSGAGRNITLKVSTKLESKPTYTVCGTIFGKQEPDRYVMFGNHRDSWTYGAADPSSGTAVMTEIVRALGTKLKKGWRPLRSIMACSWGAEEPGILGSTEWADENHKFLTNNVAAYLNVDMAVEGNFTVRLKTLDYLSEGVFKMAKLIPAPDDASLNLYQDWLAKSKLLKKDDSLTKPKFTAATSGSDYKPMWHTYGTPIADFRYIFSKLDNYKKFPQNPHYHTAYESFGWMDKFVDAGFTHHLAIGRLWAGHALLIADSDILPYNLVQFTQQMEKYFISFETYYMKMLGEQGITLDFARKRITALVEKAGKFHDYITSDTIKESSDSMKLRSINDKLMNFERNFLITGLAKNTATRHSVYATSSDTLKYHKFNGIGEAIKTAVDTKSDWDEVRKQITLFVWCVDTANRSLDLEVIP